MIYGKLLLLTSFYLTISFSPLHFSPKAKWKVNKVCRHRDVVQDYCVMLFIEIQSVWLESTVYFILLVRIIITLALSTQSKNEKIQKLTKWQRIFHHIQIFIVHNVVINLVYSIKWYVKYKHDLNTYIHYCQKTVCQI